MTAFFREDCHPATPPHLALFRDLGISPLARQIGLQSGQTFGKWCTPCAGIWFGSCLEVQCPRCGNRKG